MKTKILALIISILCLSLIFVACDEPCETHVDENNDGSCDVCGEKVETETETDTETETETETEGLCEHKDEDANKVCDNCGKAIINIVEQIPVEAETVDEMEINEIGTDDVSGYVNTELSDYHSYVSSGKIESSKYMVGEFMLTETTSDDGTVTYKIIDISSDNLNAVFTVSNHIDGYNEIRYTVALAANWFTVRADTYGQNPINATKYDVFKEYTIDIYTYANDRIGEQYRHVDGSTDTDPVISTLARGSAPELYVSYQDKIFVIDTNTEKLIHTADPDTLVDRPEMDFTVGTNGYILEDDASGSFKSLYVYDLTKWIDCTYSHTVPSEYQNTRANILQNGNVLITADVRLADTAVSYDYISAGAKYDVVYEIVDIAAKTVTPVEFGYYIDYVNGIDPELNDFYTDKAGKYNLALVYPIVGGYIDYNSPLALIVGNDLQIACKVDIPDAWLVAKDIFMRFVDYDNDGNDDAYELVTIDGEHIEYLPINGNFGQGYMVVDNGSTLVTYDNKELIDLTKYTVVKFVFDEFMLLQETIDNGPDAPATINYYRYVFGSAFVKITDSHDGWTLNAFDFGYEIRYTTDEGAVVYEAYNAKGEKLFTSGSAVISFDKDSGLVYVGNDDYYVLK